MRLCAPCVCVPSCAFVVVGSSCRALAGSWLLFCAVGSQAPRPLVRSVGAGAGWLPGFGFGFALGVWWGVAGPAGGLTLVPAAPLKDAFGLEGVRVLFVPLRRDALPHG